jgi:hypothetical protein
MATAAWGMPCPYLRGPGEVERELPFQDFVVGEVVGPAVGVEDGVVELAVGVLEPGGVLVVEVGQGVGVESKTL